jgi:hypothetical protein
MGLNSALAAKGELIMLKEKLINFGFAIVDGKLSNIVLVKRLAKCIDNAEELKVVVWFDYDEV